MPRKKQRLQAIDQELVNTVHQQIQDNILESKLDDELFIIDTRGSKNAKGRITKEKIQKQSLSKGEKKQLTKAKTKQIKNQNKIESLTEQKVYDLWSDERSSSNISSQNLKDKSKAPIDATKKKRSLTSLIKSGMSYNPALDQHQEVLAEALLLEQKKVEKEEKSKLSLLNSMPIVPSNIMNNKALLTDTHDEFYNVNQKRDNEEEDDDDDDDEGNNNLDSSNPVSLKKAIKMKLTTTAEKNKKRDRKDNLYKETQERKKKELMHDIKLLPTLIKEIKKNTNKQIQLKQSKTKEITLLQKKKQADALIKLSYEDAGSIPLSDELNGTLRQLKPKGNQMKDFALWKVKTGEAMSKDRRKRRAYEKPHGRENVKWIQAVK